jgi:hypothetical protein
MLTIQISLYLWDFNTTYIIIEHDIKKLQLNQTLKQEGNKKRYLTKVSLKYDANKWNIKSFALLFHLFKAQHLKYLKW